LRAKQSSCLAIRARGKIIVGSQAMAIRPHRALPIEVFGCPTEAAIEIATGSISSTAFGPVASMMRRSNTRANA
jgi:hypothetical protein